MSAPREPPQASAAAPLEPFGLVLHRDGSWTHEGIRISHPRLRAAFDRSVRYLPGARVYVVQLGRFRGQIEVEEGEGGPRLRIAGEPRRLPGDLGAAC